MKTTDRENELFIRKATIDDIRTIGFLAHAIWPEAYKEIISQSQIGYMLNLFYSPDSLKDQMTKHRFLLAELGKRPVGFASFSLLDEPGIYKLHKLYIITGIQGKGFGRSLIKHILKELIVLNAFALDLNVNRNNKARWFYEKLGFKIIGKEDIDIGSNFWMNDYVMRIKISDYSDDTDVNV